MKRLQKLLAVVGLLLAASIAAHAAPKIDYLKLEVNGRTWTYTLVTPSDTTGPLPLVLVFHGAGGSGALSLQYEGWAALAEREGFMVAAADGLPAVPNMPAEFGINPRIWNSGEVPPTQPRARIDDVKFVAALLDDIARRGSVDVRHVYAAGHSNGAGMVYRLGMQMPERFAAIAPVMGQNTQRGTPARAVPTMVLVGTRDPVFPPEGGARTTPFGSSDAVPPQSDSTNAWAKSLGCAIPASVTVDDARLQVEEFAGCRGQAPYSVWHVKGQGHGWPGASRQPEFKSTDGPEVGSIDATALIWRFFATQSLPPAGK